MSILPHTTFTTKVITKKQKLWRFALNLEGKNGDWGKVTFTTKVITNKQTNFEICIKVGGEKKWTLGKKKSASINYLTILYTDILHFK